MLCFFIAGIQPKTIYLDDQPRECPFCGLCQAHLKQVNHYLALFFIPVFRVKKGASFLECMSCGAISHETGEMRQVPHGPASRFCPYCGKIQEPEFRFCPYCGKAI